MSGDLRQQPWKCNWTAWERSGDITTVMPEQLKASDVEDLATDCWHGQGESASKLNLRYGGQWIRASGMPGRTSDSVARGAKKLVVEQTVSGRKEEELENHRAAD